MFGRTHLGSVCDLSRFLSGRILLGAECADTLLREPKQKRVEAPSYQCEHEKDYGDICTWSVYEASEDAPVSDSRVSMC